MGEHEGWPQTPSGLLPNGLLPDEAASVLRMLDSERWLKAEERTAELIACIQPNLPSEERRNAVADYVHRLITKCFPCQVFTFGSVPLKTYLPDGDIDLTAFSKNQNLKDTWAHQVRDILESEEKNENAEFHVKEVQYIQAEVKIIKCLVENIVVDISFNQLGGLCTLCFLEEVDHLINHNYLFKRSIILIKAWCYYESRILGAHHGLISTYALETLVLYIFHVFNNSFAGPLEVLYRFLEFFSKFDWDNFCVSLWGPVPISSLPDVTAEPPRKDGGDLLLSKLFLDACSSVYAVFPGGQENQGQAFISKHFNVIDPLRVNNNLGRSVSKGNFFRIRSAFAFGAKRLARLLECPREDLLFEVNQFFMNTWERHGSGQRPDAPRNDLWCSRLSNSDRLQGSVNVRKITINQKNENISGREVRVERMHASRSVVSQQCNSSSESASKTSDVSTTSRNPSQKSSGNQISKPPELGKQENISKQSAQVDKGQRSSKPESLVNDVQGRFLFARTRSSPELTDTYGETSFQGRPKRAPESARAQLSSVRLDNNQRKNMESDVPGSYSSRVNDSSSVRNISSHQSVDASADSNSGSNSYHEESGSGVMGDDFASVTGSQMMHQEEQDLINMMASPHNFNGQVHLPLNLSSGHLPHPFPPSMLASIGYAPRNMGTIPLIETPWGTNMQFTQGSPLTHYFPGMGLGTNHDESIDLGNENFSSAEMSIGDADSDFWHEQDRVCASGVELENGRFDDFQSDDKEQSMSGSYNFIQPYQVDSSHNFMRNQQIFTRESRESMKEDHTNTPNYQDIRGNEIYLNDGLANSRSLHSEPLSSMRGKISSESSCEGSSAKLSKSTREKRGRKNAPSRPSSMYGKGKNVSEVFSAKADDGSKEWAAMSTIVSETVERNTVLPSVPSVHVPRHQISGFEPDHTSGSESFVPIAPVLLGPASRQRSTDNPGVAPFAFYPTGPPVPFFMLPVYNLSSEAGSLDMSTSNFIVEEIVSNSDSRQNFDSLEGFKQPGLSSTSMKRAIAVEPSEHKSDILKSDFASHWQNLQYGRFCQNSRHVAPLIYPSPVMVPPVYLQGRIPWDGPGRPLSANMNFFTQLMSYGPRLFPLAPLQSVSSRPPGVYQRFVDDMPRYRSGTGTYLPNPASIRDWHSSSTRRGNYSYDRSDHHGDREGNSNMNSKLRAFGRSHNRVQFEKTNSRPERLAKSESQADRPWSSHRHESFPSYQTHNGPSRSGSSNSSPANVAYSMYPLQAMNPGGVSANGPTMPPVVMFYPYDHNAGYGSPAELLEFGSIGPMGFAGVGEFAQVNEGNLSSGPFDEPWFNGGSTQQDSPDKPSSPHLPRDL